MTNETDARLNALAGKYKLSRSEVVRQLVNQVYEAEFGEGG